MCGVDEGKKIALTFTTFSVKYLRKLLQSLFGKIGGSGASGETV